MRKLVILAIALSINIVAFGQRTIHSAPIGVNSFNDCDYSFLHGNPFARTTAIGDTFVLSNIPTGDSLVIYPATGTTDSGYLTGTDVFNDIGFAENYTINGNDSSLVLIGVVALFKGTVTPSSSLTVTFDAWDETPYIISPTFEYSGFPNDCLDSLVVLGTELGIGASTDTIKTFLFPMVTDTVGGGTDINYVGSSFYIGYTINYVFGLLDGDTLGLACTMNGVRGTTTPTYSIGTYIDTVINAEGTGDSAIYVIDTIVNVQNVTQHSDYSWHDNYTDNDSLYNDLAIYPIVVIVNGPTGINSVSRKDLTFFGNYPNPAVDYTNIKFSLLQNADVTIQIMDMNGRVLNTINDPNLSIGQHIIPVNTSSLPSGNYLYFVHTSTGGGVASKMTVIR